MEMSSGYMVSLIMRSIRRCIIVLLLLPIAATAQDKKPQYIIDDGRMVIRLDIHVADSILNNFVFNYNLTDLDLPGLIKSNITDSLRKNGWRIDMEKNGMVVISKRLNELKSAGDEKPEDGEDPERQEQPEKPEKKSVAEVMQMISDISKNTGEGQSNNNSSSQSGVNHFINKGTFYIADSLVTFYLRAHFNAHDVYLAGSFTGWQKGRLAMQKTDSGWIVNVPLNPGKYYYKFIVDGNWVDDKDNLLLENDGDGNNNSVYYKTNKVFYLNGFANAKKVVLAGSFDKWSADDIVMEKTATGWQVPVYLAPGAYTYRFVVDGNWMTDPANEQKVPNEYDDYNSFIAIGMPYVFRLQGYRDAKDVSLAGTFNNWQAEQLHMMRTATGWELPYALGPGNYEYKFIVDGKWISDPANPLKVVNDNSYFILEPNYTFRLKGFPDARAIYLAGDFDHWSANTLLMTHSGDEWTCSVYLSPGKHLYKFVVDGKWTKDPNNPLWEDEDNSVIWKTE